MENEEWHGSDDPTDSVINLWAAGSACNLLAVIAALAGLFRLDWRLGVAAIVLCAIGRALLAWGDRIDGRLS